MASDNIRKITDVKGCTPAQVLFKVAQMNGVPPISGTTQEKHMSDAVEVDRLDLGDVQPAVDAVLEIIRT